MTWPTHPDGSNKTIGEMTAEERGVLEIYCRDAGAFVEVSGTCIGCGAEPGVACRSTGFSALGRPAHSLSDIAAANPDAPWSRQLRMQGEKTS